ncbi:hypothetical protein E4U21_002699 [Claviceps maximensis]|nr:hypothetical protein E4U21_002699 [Claviceps maximensis]
MTPPLRILLSWYRDATQKLTTPSPDARYEAAVLDGEGPAMNDLLRRQALSLLRLHDAVGIAGVNEEMETRARTTLDAIKSRLLEQRLEDLASVSMSKLYAYRYDQVPYHWRQIYAEALILRTFHTILRDGAVEGGGGGDGTWLRPEALDSIVESLDRALITAGGAGILGREWIEKTLALLEELDCRAQQQRQEQPQDTNDRPERQHTSKHDSQDSRPNKRARFHAENIHWLPTHEPYPRPGPLSEKRCCARHKDWSLARFEGYMNAETGLDPRPIVFTDLVSSWPALTDRPWKSREYLLRRTFGGRRLVPVEVGRSYVDEGWGQELMPFGKFLDEYVVGGGGGGGDEALMGHGTGTASAPAAERTGYLAQHDLFRQIPMLRNDVCIPDFCWTTVPGNPTRNAETHHQQQKHAPLDEPLLNAWFGPARTITPLHTDGYHNLLVQVVGTKYVRLYAPWAKGMSPRATENGIDMSNTSALDLGVLEGWDDDAQRDDAPSRHGGARAHADEDPSGNDGRARTQFQENEYWECILEEGETLLIPMGWWHYVRSLSVSFSVSFWWN